MINMELTLIWPTIKFSLLMKFLSSGRKQMWQKTEVLIYNFLILEVATCKEKSQYKKWRERKTFALFLKTISLKVTSQT